MGKGISEVEKRYTRNFVTYTDWIEKVVHSLILQNIQYISYSDGVMHDFHASLQYIISIETFILLISQDCPIHLIFLCICAIL